MIIKGAKGLKITNFSENLLLLVCNGVVKDAPLSSGKAWTLGNYISEFGGIQAIGKRTLVSLPQLIQTIYLVIWKRVMWMRRKKRYHAS